jgi:hypothetical protein
LLLSLNLFPQFLPFISAPYRHLSPSCLCLYLRSAVSCSVPSALSPLPLFFPVPSYVSIPSSFLLLPLSVFSVFLPPSLTLIYPQLLFPTFLVFCLSLLFLFQPVFAICLFLLSLSSVSHARLLRLYPQFFPFAPSSPPASSLSIPPPVYQIVFITITMIIIIIAQSSLLSR